MFGTTVVTFDNNRPAGLVYQRAPSAFVNYGATWGSHDGRTMNLESGVTLGAALATSSLSLSSYGRPARGLSSVTVDDRRRLNRYVAGDTVVSTGPLGGALQVAGASVSRDFNLDPYFIRYPTTGLSGVVTTPSRVELYVNNQLVRVAQIQPGSYELANLVLPTGAANTRVVVRDAFGGTQEFGGAFYITTAILAKGVQQFQYVAGAERLRPYDSMWDYGQVVVAGSHRIGLTNAITLGGRVEVEPELTSVGPTVAARVGRFGAVELSGGASRLSGRTGLAGSIAYKSTGGPGGVQIAWRQMSQDYATLTTRRAAGQPGPRIRDGGDFPGHLGDPRGGLARGGLSRRPGPGPTRIGLRAAASQPATLAVPLGHAEPGGRRVAAGRVCGAERGCARSHERQHVGRAPRPSDAAAGRCAAVGAGRPGAWLPHPDRWSGHRPPALIDGELRAQSRWGTADLRQSISDGQASTFAQVTGGLVAIGGRVIATRPVQEGFALVRVPGVAGVRTYVSHQEVGRTDRRGDLLVPNLLAYYGNEVTIADSDVPVDRALDASRMVIAPPFRGGAVVKFVAPRQWRVTGTVVVTGEPDRLAGNAGARALLRVDGADGPIESELGLDGEFYLEGLTPGVHRGQVDFDGSTCTLTLVVPEREAPVLRLGQVACVPPRCAHDPPRGGGPGGGGLGRAGQRARGGGVHAFGDPDGIWRVQRIPGGPGRRDGHDHVSLRQQRPQHPHLDLRWHQRHLTPIAR